MDLSIKNTTKEQRLDIVKNALAISITGSDKKKKKVLRIAKEYVSYIIEADIAKFRVWEESKTTTSQIKFYKNRKNS